MPPTFKRSAEFRRVVPELETEVLDAYAQCLDSGQEDVLLQNVPGILDELQIPQCYTKDIAETVQWFQDTRHLMLAGSAKWAVAEQLLRHLTISVVVNGQLDVSEVVDIDKLVVFCNRLLKFRDHHEYICSNWALFVEAAGLKTTNPAQQKLTLAELLKVKSYLQLDDISDAILIGMIGCAGSSPDGELYNYTLTKRGPVVSIKDFAEIMGQLGKYD